MKLYCHICGKFVGEREQMVMKIVKGTQVDIIVTCPDCQKPKYDVPDFFDILLNRGK